MTNKIQGMISGDSPQETTHGSGHPPLELSAERQIVFLGRTPFELFSEERKWKEYGRHSNEIVFDSLPFDGRKYEFVFNNKTKMPELNPNADFAGDYERVLVDIVDAFRKELFEPWMLDIANRISREEQRGVYFADSYMPHRLAEGHVEIMLNDKHNFRFEAVNWQLVDSENPRNIIRLEDLPNWGYGYEMYYDPQIRNLAPYEAPGIEASFLTEMVHYDPLSMAEKFDISMSRLPPQDETLFNEKFLAYAKHTDFRQIEDVAGKHRDFIASKAQPVQAQAQLKQADLQKNAGRRKRSKSI